MARSLRILFLFSLSMMAAIPAPVAAQQDTTVQAAADSVSRQDTAGAVSSDSAVEPDTVQEASADSVAAFGGTGTDSTAAGQPPAPPPITYEEGELQTVARVLVAIEELRQKYHARQGLPADSLSGALGLHAQFRAEVARMVEGHGITMEFYSEVIHRARERPALRKQLLEHAAAVRE